MAHAREPRRITHFLISSVILHAAVGLALGQWHYTGSGGFKSDAEIFRSDTVAVRLVRSPAPTDLALADKTIVKDSLQTPSSTKSAHGSTTEFVDQGYHSSGLLTKLPVPLTDVDLNVAPLNTHDASGKVELTLFVDTSGHVADVIATGDTAVQPFALLVGEHFRKVRFSPGEIHGRRVKSKITIVVNSEPLPPQPIMSLLR